MEPKEDGFYYDAKGVRYKIIPNMDDPNHRIVYYECVTTVEDFGHTTQQAEVVHLQSFPKKLPKRHKFKDTS
jgi:hypothetical protein